MYLCTVISGCVSLIYQVVWQRYLAILVGGEARSLSLVVAIFLLGLASGYYVFGRLTEKNLKRNQLLKIYGYIELGIAAYAILFPQLFWLLKSLSFNGPPLFIFDIFITCLALLVPTFLMGASIPMLTMAIPETSEEVNSCHAQVYGWNTFGAFIGTLTAGFILIPQWGLPLTMYFAGVLNLCISFVFLVNPLSGTSYKSKDLTDIKTLAPGWFYLLLAFISGAVIISLETNLVRILNLSIGSGIYNFPIVLSIFILGLALGSLCLKTLSVRHLISRLFISIILLSVLSLTIPYWAIWLNHIRVSLKTIETNYIVYLSATYVFVFLFLFPPVFFLGQLLPLIYALIHKTRENYGRVCGRLYFSNTIGTVLGATVLGFLALYVIELDHLFKIGLVSLCVLCLVFTFYERLRGRFLISLILLVGCLFLPRWDRVGHYVGYFRNRDIINSLHFKGVFSLIPNPPKGDVFFFQDGPNTSVALIKYRQGDEQSKEILSLAKMGYPKESYSIFVNGKSDSNVRGDFQTLFLLPTLPVLFFPIEEHVPLSTAVVGLGTGVSAGLMGKLDEVKDVTVLEISPKVIEAVKKIDHMNFNATSNPKIKIKELDAFKFFTRNTKKIDIIMSEPTNPWVIGVENLYTVDFYQLARRSLSENGILAQWMHLYDMSPQTFQLAASAILKSFEYVEIYQIGLDVVFLASLKPLRRDILKKNIARNFYFTPLLRAMGFQTDENIYFLKGLSNRALKSVGKTHSGEQHSLERPLLSYPGFKDFFMGRETSLDTILTEPVQRAVGSRPELLAAFETYKNLRDHEINSHCPYGRIDFLCRKIRHAVRQWRIFQNSNYSMYDRKRSYGFLRRQGYIKADPVFINEIREQVLKDIKWANSMQAIEDYIQALVLDGSFQSAYLELEEFKQHLSDVQYEKIKDNIQTTETSVKDSFAALN